MLKAKKNIIGPQLRELRNARKLSQAAFAALCQQTGWGMTREIIARIEGQVRCVTDIELCLLAEILSVGVEKLLPAPAIWRQEHALRAAVPQTFQAWPESPGTA